MITIIVFKGQVLNIRPIVVTLLRPYHFRLCDRTRRLLPACFPPRHHCPAGIHDLATGDPAFRRQTVFVLQKAGVNQSVPGSQPCAPPANILSASVDVCARDKIVVKSGGGGGGIVRKQVVVSARRAPVCELLLMLVQTAD